MTTLPTPQQSAHEILAIFVWHFGLLAGEVLPSNSFSALWQRRGYRPEDFNAGLLYAIESGWLEVLPGGNSYRLTKSGFADA